MRFTKSQIAKLSKWSKAGRAYVGFSIPPEDLPEWAKQEFAVARELIRISALHVKSSVFDESQAKSMLRMKAYSEGAKKAWATRKRQARARAAAAAEAAKGRAA